MNIEVSMPTGTLCSERNAIGTALAKDPTLTRRDFRMIAILSATLNKTPGNSGAWLCIYDIYKHVSSFPGEPLTQHSRVSLRMMCKTLSDFTGPNNALSPPGP